jgi:hypothetical protein
VPLLVEHADLPLATTRSGTLLLAEDDHGLRYESALEMSDWIDGTAAVLQAWFMGQAGGGAIADVLFGVVNPGGRPAPRCPRAIGEHRPPVHASGEHRLRQIRLTPDD